MNNSTMPMPQYVWRFKEKDDLPVNILHNIILNSNVSLFF